MITNDLIAELARADEARRRATDVWPCVWPAFDAASSVRWACLQGGQADDHDIRQGPLIVVADASKRVDWWRSRLPLLWLTTSRQKQQVRMRKKESLRQIPEGATVPMVSSVIAPYLTMRLGGVPEHMTEAQVRAWTVPAMREWLLDVVLAECFLGKPCRLP